MIDLTSKEPVFDFVIAEGHIVGDNVIVRAPDNKFGPNTRSTLKLYAKNGDRVFGVIAVKKEDGQLAYIKVAELDKKGTFHYIHD